MRWIWLLIGAEGVRSVSGYVVRWVSVCLCVPCVRLCGENIAFPRKRDAGEGFCIRSARFSILLSLVLVGLLCPVCLVRMYECKEATELQSLCW